MTTATPTASVALDKGVSPATVMRLHLTQRASLALTPLGIIALVFLVTGIITLVFLQSGSEPGSPGWVEGSRSNPALIWALPGFLGWLGVQTVSLTFPLGLSLGSTRRNYVLGTVATHTLIAVYLTVLMLALLALETLTGHWFLGVYVMDVAILGSGDPLQLALTVFLASMLMLSGGGVFAAAWVRFGSLGPIVLAVATVLVLGAIVVLVIPTAIVGFEPWWLVVASLTMTVLAVAGQYLFLLRASAR